jgi:hypothetical protein
MRIAGGFKTIDNVGFNVAPPQGSTTIVDWDLSSFTFAGNSPSINSNIRQPFWKNDGTIFYIAQSNGDISQYTPSVAWDVSSIPTTPTKTQSFTAQESSALQSMYIKDDGTKLWICGNTGNSYQYTLNTPWEIDSAVYDSKTFDHVNETGFPIEVIWSDDGTIMWLGSYSPPTLFKYNASTPFDLGSITYSTQSYNTGISANIEGWWVNPKGTQFITGGLSENTVISYTMNTVNDPTSSVLSNSQSIPFNNPNGFFVRPNGQRVYISNGDSSRVRQYDL